MRYLGVILRMRSAHSTSAMKPNTKTFALQSTLPRLPIPTLEETAAKYLRSIEPLATQEEHSRNQSLMADFLDSKGIGPELQRRLVKYDKEQPHSWLEDIWLNKAYLEWREPIPINSNWFILMRDPPQGLPAADTKVVPDYAYTEGQLCRAATYIRHVLEFKLMIDKYSVHMISSLMDYREAIPVEYTKTSALCMNQYRRMFGVTRVPDIPGDRLVGGSPTKATHIIVIIRNQLYKLEVMDDPTTSLPTEAILHQLHKIVQQAAEISDPSPPISILTSTHRDLWAKAHNSLEKLSPENQKSFAVIETALFNISLDEHTTTLDVNQNLLPLFHGYNGCNIWFDKALSFVVFPNGRIGCNGEHSPCDAVIPSIMFDFAVKKEAAGTKYKADQFAKMPKLKTPERLKFVVSPKVLDAISSALISSNVAIKDIELVEHHFEQFGTECIKSEVKTSPDSFFQAAMQLAYFRLHKRVTATYETASTRQFKHGRTETVRVLSKESQAFVKAMIDVSLSPITKHRLFRAFISAHRTYLADATNGKGVDRHLLGLRCMLRPGERHPIFEDPLFGRSCTFGLSTSNVSPGDSFLGMGFGPVVATGYGINYSLSKNRIRFSVASKRSCVETNSIALRDAICRALLDLKELATDPKAALELPAKL